MAHSTQPSSVTHRTSLQTKGEFDVAVRARSKLHVVLKAKGCFQSKNLIGEKVFKIKKFTIKFTY